MTTVSTLDPATSMRGEVDAEPPVALGLALLWSVDEPERSGEVALFPRISRSAELLLGRGGAGARGLAGHLHFARQRPGANEPTGLLRSPRISRVQLKIRQPDADTLEVENVGRCPLLVGDAAVPRARLRVGDVIEIDPIAVLMVVARPRVLPTIAGWPAPLHPFGRADRFGLVGEGPAAWALRAALAFAGPRAAHVLVRGESGAGKELIAQALHALSPRGGRPLVARNAATIPETLIDAELFGNARNFPNAGMPERPGLIGEADGGSLLLDEFGELPVSVQTHLLRVLDAGEYSRLGEARARRADLRLIAATNRPLAVIKEDVLARLRLRIDVPGLRDRREDVPLIAAHLLRRLGAGDPLIARRCFADGELEGSPRLTARLVAALARWPYETHVRELEGLLWRALAAQGEGQRLDLPPGLAPAPAAAAGPPAGPHAPAAEPVHAPATAPEEIPPAQIQALLDAHDGRQEPVWRALGFSSRHVLTRLVRRHGLRVRGRGKGDGDDEG